VSMIKNQEPELELGIMDQERKELELENNDR
jgi:hypothetical protein